MRLIFVHGWSVTHTNNYRDLPQSVARLAQQQQLEVSLQHLYLAKYISFHDQVTLDDIARALQQALRDLPGNEHSIQPFSCVTHSTGGPVVRYWLNKFYGAQGLEQAPLKHLVMLAPANQGSSLATLGQKRVGRIKAWFGGVEPGKKVLDWLKLGSDGQYLLNKASRKFRYAENDIYPFVIAGQGIDSKAYDFLNSYLTENGTDGIIRVAGTNLNSQFLTLQQTHEPIHKTNHSALHLRAATKSPKRSTPVPLLVMNDASHAGPNMGLLNSKASQQVHTKIASHIVDCLRVQTIADYRQIQQRWRQITEQQQLDIPVGKNQLISRYGMLVFRVTDQAGTRLDIDDFDLLLLAGKSYSADKLPSGFFVDRQVNLDTQTLTYYVDIDKLHRVKDGCFGIAVHARPTRGFSYYRKAEFRAEPEQLKQLLQVNTTHYFDIQLQRFVDKNVFRFDRGDQPSASFKGVKEQGESIP